MRRRNLCSRILSRLLVALALPAFAGETRITLLATTDLHGHIYPVDYYTAKPAERGLAKIATLIRQARAENPNTLLIDCGDTIQGSPLEYVWQTHLLRGRPPLGLGWAGPPPAGDPMMLAMSRLGYDAMAVGNHEFNFGLKNLEKARNDARFPWIAANIAGGSPGAGRPFAPYILKTVGGVKVAVVGIITPSVPSWEKPENLGSYRFLEPVDVLKKLAAELRRGPKPDLVIVAAHSGLDGVGGNRVREITAAVPGIDAVVFGHSHQELSGERAGKVLLLQPKNWGISLGRMEFTLERKPDAWALVHSSSRVIRVTRDTPADEEILRLAAPYHELAERYLETPVAESARLLEGRLGRVEDTALVDAIHAVQLRYAGADVSFTSLFHPGVTVAPGPVTVRQIAALYVYDNELYAIEGNGRMVKEALENAARYFLSCRQEGCFRPPLINRQVMGFNYDTAQGVAYEIDLTRPEGGRIRNLRWKGRPLAAGQKLRIAVNSYRYAGSAGYGMFRGARILWRSGVEIRDLMIGHYARAGRLPAAPDGNWRILPAEARRTLEAEALAGGGY